MVLFDRCGLRLAKHENGNSNVATKQKNATLEHPRMAFGGAPGSANPVVRPHPKKKVAFVR